MNSFEYKFKPESKNKDNVFQEKFFSDSEDNIKKELNIAIIGSRENSPEENQEKFGIYIANIFDEKVKEASRDGKMMIFDMATGSSPKSVWSAIENMVKSGSLDISNVIVIGHEEAWGEYESGSKSDFDAYRKKEFFDRNNIEAKPIVSIDDVSSDNIQGNFIPMHLTNDAPSSAQKYLQILQALQKRKDVSWFGLYGVGTDGHIGEMQVHALGMQESLKRRHVYSDNIEHYSVERGAFQWKNNGKESDNDFHPESNIFWQRNTNKDIGRAVWQGYTSIKDVVSLGWREMIEQDTLILAFNDRGKSLAFQLALEGSLSGKIIDGNGDTTMEVAKDSGERGKILIDLENYALGLEEIGILKKGSVVENRESKSPSKIHDLFKVIYSSFDFIELSHDNPKYKEMWEFSNRYLGKTSPVSRLIKLRSMRGKETKLIATPEVIQDTPYEILLKE